MHAYFCVWVPLQPLGAQSDLEVGGYWTEQT